MSSHDRIDAVVEDLAQRLEQDSESVRSFTEKARFVFENSEFCLVNAERYPDEWIELLLSGALDTPPSQSEFASRLAGSLAETEEEETLHRELRLFRRRQMIRIIWRDLHGTALDETLESLSALADVCIGTALDFLYDMMVESLGTPRDSEGNPQRMVVIGMGKLGARELNLSSDVDLIYTYPSSGQTDGKRELSNEQFFTRLGQKLTKALTTRTVDGFVFRVDTRLRPFGDSGPLAANFDFMEEYYQAQAREWERYAMIKARVVAGDMENGQVLMDLLRPFVFRRYLDYGAIESLRKMKRMISDDLKRKGMRDNLKLGPGGIREIEFIGQAFQLIRGGRDHALQIRPIQEVLRLLADRELLPTQVSEELIAAYRFLRLAENRIQAWKDEQTHLLPEDEAGLERMATTMNFDSIDKFIAVMAEHRVNVQHHFEQLFSGPGEEEEEISPLTAVWSGDVDPEALEKIMRDAGFDDPDAALEIINKWRESHAFQGAGPRGSELLESLIPRILTMAAATGNANTTLDRLGKILETIARRTTYIALLNENQAAAEQLVTLVSASPWFAQWISRQPILLDALIDPRQLYTPLTREALQEELQQLIAPVEGDLEQEMEVLRHFASINRLRVAAADVSQVIPLMIVSDYLTEIAEIVLEEALRLAWRDMVERYGKPSDAGDGTGFAIIGYGKLGGIELGYGSDLDLVFLHNSSMSTMTDGQKQLAADTFYARLAQRLIHILTARTPSGQLYEVDMRLRPNGASGMLVPSLHAFERYQKEEAWTWEHQALVRARAVAGDPVVIDLFNNTRREILCDVRDPHELRGEVINMREKMRASMDKSSDTMFDLKQGRGGITDIEFMVQYSILRWSHDHVGLCEYSDNIRQLEALEEEGLLEESWEERLAGIYRVLRAATHRKALQEEPALIEDSELREERKLVGEAWALLMESGEN